MKFVIKTPLGLVAGFACGCVQIAGTADFAKLFATKAAAEKFVAKYADAGYGLLSSTAEVTPA